MREMNKPEIVSDEPLLSLQELCYLCSLEEGNVIEMVQIGILYPEGEHTQDWHFSLFQLQRVKKAQKLKKELKLNLQGIALSLELLDEIKALRENLKQLHHQLQLLNQ